MVFSVSDKHDRTFPCGQSEYSLEESEMLLTEVQASSHLFSNFDPSDIEILTSEFFFLRLKQGQVVYDSDKDAKYFALVIKGKFHVQPYSGENTGAGTSDVITGQIAGDAAFLAGEPCNMLLECLSDEGILGMFRSADIESLHLKDPKLGMRLVAILMESERFNAEEALEKEQEKAFKALPVGKGSLLKSFLQEIQETGRNRMFKVYTDRELGKIAEHMGLVHFLPEEQILKAGDKGVRGWEDGRAREQRGDGMRGRPQARGLLAQASCVLVLLKGSADVRVNGNMIYTFSQPGEILGESFLIKRERKADVVAKSEVSFAVLNQEMLDALNTECPDISMKLLRSLAKFSMENSAPKPAVNEVAKEEAFGDSEEGGGDQRMLQFWSSETMQQHKGAHEVAVRRMVLRQQIVAMENADNAPARTRQECLDSVEKQHKEQEVMRQSVMTSPAALGKGQALQVLSSEGMGLALQPGSPTLGNLEKLLALQEERMVSFAQLTKDLGSEVDSLKVKNAKLRLDVTDIRTTNQAVAGRPGWGRMRKTAFLKPGAAANTNVFSNVDYGEMMQKLSPKQCSELMSSHRTAVRLEQTIEGKEVQVVQGPEESREAEGLGVSNWGLISSRQQPQHPSDSTDPSEALELMERVLFAATTTIKTQRVDLENLQSEREENEYRLQRAHTRLSEAENSLRQSRWKVAMSAPVLMMMRAWKVSREKMRNLKLNRGSSILHRPSIISIQVDPEDEELSIEDEEKMQEAAFDIVASVAEAEQERQDERARLERKQYEHVCKEREAVLTVRLRASPRSSSWRSRGQAGQAVAPRRISALWWFLHGASGSQRAPDGRLRGGAPCAPAPPPLPTKCRREAVAGVAGWREEEERLCAAQAAMMTAMQSQPLAPR
ncbi:hypothetical protein CYMTET_17186 [Cymbomonas tetramitiformis]|uniref:Cyclic nucleotide-binding domain-containing protein n=1 Tax=Cymbomonas tetramitiformis TaxID=36881 RepID=A0AAE0L769_9CHLO|nr:hypothetical protein CYMTET_17186 [Cymbomonas tetramitiformis]